MGRAVVLGARRVGSAALVGLILLATLPVMPVWAALPAPVLVSPVGTTVTDVVVDLRWERVPGAATYNVKVWYGSDQDANRTVDEWTVNDRHIALVNYQGDVAHWSVRAFGPDNVPGPAAQASFTTARMPATLVWPADGAALVHPDIAATPTWRGVPGQHEGLFADHDTGSQAPIATSAPTVWTPGSWRWGVQGSADPHPFQPAPASERRSFTFSWPTAVPAPVAPAAGASIASGTAFRLSWAEAAGAAMYQWELVRTADGSVVAGSTGKAPWADIGPFLAAGGYTWRVRATMAGTLSPLTEFRGPWSTPRALVITAPAAPTLTGPADGATVTSWPTLRWDPVPGAGHYLVQVATSEDPDAPLVAPGSLVGAFAFRSTGTATDLSAGDPTGGTRYWRVMAQLPYTGAPIGGWSEWRSFTVNPPGGALGAPVAATMLGPDDCASDACPDLVGVPFLRWSPVAKAAWYRVFLRWDGGSGAADSWFDVASTSAPLPQIHQAQVTDRTAWAVVACPAGACTEVMPATRRHFRVRPGAPAPLAPADGTTQQTPSIAMSWTPPAAPDEVDALATRVGYEVNWRLTPGAYGDPTDNHIDGTDGTLFSVDAIRDGAAVEWRVRLVLPFVYGSTSGAWSPWRTVTRDELPLPIVGPADGATVDATPRLDWGPATYAASGYAVHIVNVGQPQVTVWGAKTGATAVEAGPLPPGTYSWTVFRTASMYYQGDGDGPVTSGTFTVAGDPRLHAVAPLAGASVRADDAVLEWEPAPLAGDYAVMIGQTPDVTWETAVYTGWSPSNVHAVTELLPEGDLYWRVCTRNECSDAAGFAAGTTDAELMHVTAAPGPDVTTPQASATPIVTRGGSTLSSAGAIPATITWTASDAGGSGIASQAVQLKRGSGSWSTTSVSAAARSASIALLPGSTYAARIRVTDGAGNVGYSATQQVTTSLRQETSSAWRWSSGWTRVSSTTASGGYTRYATRDGASAVITFTGRSISLVAPRSSGRGSAWIYLDGIKVATVKLYATPTGARRIVFTKAWPTSGSHTLRVRLLGTAGHPRFDVDAFAILK